MGVFSVKAPASTEPVYDGKPRVIYAQNGYEVWAKWENGPGIFELFLSEDCSDYVGCADSYIDARIIAREIVEEASDVAA